MGSFDTAHGLFLEVLFASNMLFGGEPVATQLVINRMEDSYGSCHTHQHTDKYTRHNTGLLDKTNTATELHRSVIAFRSTLGTSDVT